MADTEQRTGAAAGRTAWARNLGAPVRSFLSTETGSAVVLVAAVVVALVWANIGSSYATVWGTELSFRLGDHTLGQELQGWVDQGLMTLFFLVVGLEAKRELDLGELRQRTRLAIPVVCALGGMAVAVSLYLVINAGGDGADGWGAVVSTDTALALGSLALVGPGNSARLRVFLLTLVVVDDLVALLVIAVAYTESVSVTALIVAVVLFGVLISLRWLPGHWRAPAAAITGVGIWLAMFESGIDPVITGLAIGLVTSAYPPPRDSLERATELTRSFREQPTPELAYSAQRSLASAISPNERLQFRLHPWTSFVIVPLFALANAGVQIDGGTLSAAMRSPVTLGIVGGYVIGKPVGIALAAWFGTRMRTRLTVTWPGLAGTAATAGIGFTVSLLIIGLAFTGRQLDEAKLGVLATAVLSTLVAGGIFRITAALPATWLARQFARTADQLIDLDDDVDPARDHIRGKEDAPVTIVEYGDFECPYCGQAEPVIRELLASHDDDLRYVWRHLPLADVHPFAQMAAEASEAAAAQGEFWAMHDRLLAHQDELTPRDLRAHAEAIGLDAERFAEDMRQRRYAPRVSDDVASADASGVAGTPTFFINGRRHFGVYDIDTLTNEVRAARRRAAVVPA